MDQANIVALHRLIIAHFNTSELHTLCFDLGIEYEDLAGQGKSDKAREFVTYMVRYGRLDELVNKVRHLRPAVEWPNVGQKTGSQVVNDESIDTSAILATRRARLAADGWREGEAYMDTLIVPLPHGIPRIKLSDLRSFIQYNTISLDGYGGPPFPFEEFSHTAKVRNVSNGCELVDTGNRLYEDWTFLVWSFSTDGTFFSRASSSEDHYTEKKYTAKILRYMWMLQDIVRPLLFAQRLLSRTKRVYTVKLLFSWGGMNQRYLLDDRGFALLDAGMCQQDDITFSSEITTQTDLQATARELAERVIWLCNWKRHSEQTLDNDIAIMLSGKFPR
jgi:hypothetical protein